MMKLVMTGAECCGKTSLAKAMAKKLNKLFLPEFARTYMEAHLGKPSLLLVEKMAKTQLQQEIEYIEANKDFAILDTDLLTYIIWLKDKFNAEPEWLYTAFFKSTTNKTFVLCGDDIPYEFDPLREDENRRPEINQLFREFLINNKLPFFEVKGSVTERLKIISQKIKLK